MIPRPGDPDASLVARVQAGESSAFEELYERYKTKVYNTAYRVTGNAADAADVTQEVFLNIFRKIGLFEFRSSFSTWVYRMSVNASIDRYRKVTRHPTVSTDDETFQETRAFKAMADEKAAGADEESAKKEFDVQIQEVMSLLPSKLRTAVVLRYVQDLSYEQVAQVLGCSQGTVKSRLNRAHAKLKKLLKRVVQGGDDRGMQESSKISS